MLVVFSAHGKSWDSLVDSRLGRAENFVVYDDKTESLNIVSNDENADKEHGAGLHMAKLMMDLKADVIITGNGPGEKANALFKKSNINIYVGAGQMSLKDAYNAYKNQKLSKF